MRTLFRKLVPLVCFLLLLAALVASASKAIDQWIVILVWSAFLLGSVILVIKNVAWLPRSWQRWVLGEQGPSKIDKHRP